PGDVERSREVVDGAPRLRPSAHELDQVSAGAAAKIDDQAGAREVEVIGPPARIASGANETIHRADKTRGLLRPGLIHVCEPRRPPGQNSMLEPAPLLPKATVEQDHPAQVF